MSEAQFEHKIESPREFILAGNSYFTAQSDKSKNHLTFKVTKCEDKEMFFVAVCNTYDGYMFIGNLYANIERTSFNFVKSKKLKEDKDQLSIIVFKFIIDNYLLPGIVRTFPNTMTFYHHGKCGKCGRVLTTPESIKRGLGPFCASL